MRRAALLNDFSSAVASCGLGADEMATKADIDADLTLEIDGRNVTPDKFMRAVRAFFGLVNEVTCSLAGHQQFVHWVVQVKSASNLVGLQPSQFNVSPVVLENIYTTIQGGIESIEYEAAEPEGIPEGALKHIRELASIAGTDDADDTRVRV
jgi:hypothetical protein